MRAILGFFLILLFCGCDTQAPENTTVQRIQLETGYTLKYRWDLTFSGSGSEAVSAEKDTAIVHVIGEETPDWFTKELIRVEAYFTSAPEDLSITWYEQTTDSLIEVAYQNPSITLVFPTVLQSSQHLLKPDSLRPKLSTPIIREEPRLVYSFPLELNKSWVSFTNPFYSQRQVVEHMKIEVPAGKFTVFKINTLANNGSEGTLWSDFVNEEGLIQRTISYKVNDTLNATETLVLLK